MDQELANAVP